MEQGLLSIVEPIVALLAKTVGRDKVCRFF